VRSVPRIVNAESMPVSAAGQSLVGDELKKNMKRAAYTLLAVGIIQMTVGAVVAVILGNAPGAPPEMVYALLIAQFLVGAVFLGLYFWARRAPLPATIVGVVVYGTLLALNILASVSGAATGGRREGPRGLGIGCLDIVLIAFLIQGIQAALKYKRLQEAAAAE
jgi:heme A synthase